MRPARWQLDYVNAETGQALSLAGSLAALSSATAFDDAATLTEDTPIARVSFTFASDVLTATAQIRVPLRVTAFHVECEDVAGQDAQILLNGYQSWTDTVFREPDYAMRGLIGVPGAVVNKFALDAMGDYRFSKYRLRRGVQHGWTYGVVFRAGEYELVGSTDESRGFLRLDFDGAVNELSLVPEVPDRVLAAEEVITLLACAFIRDDHEEDVYDRWFSIAGAPWAARPAAPLVGYSSWYRHYDKIDEGKIRADLSGAKDAFAKLETQGLPAGARRVFQIDDGWCKVGDWLEPLSEKFPQGMAPLAAAIRDAGFTPGLWLAPFVCQRTSRLFTEHHDWLLRDKAGSITCTGSHWGGAYALDVRKPEVREYVRRCLGTAVEEWGFSLLKLDFLYAACLETRDGMTRGEIMREAMQLVREAVGEECLVDGCGVPLAAAFGLVDYCRIGCDVGLNWDDNLIMRQLHRERVSTKHALGNVYGRAPLDGRAFGNDPDVIFLREDVRLTRAQKLELLDAAARHGSMLLTSDDMGAWTDADLTAYLEAANALVSRVSARGESRRNA